MKFIYVKKTEIGKIPRIAGVYSFWGQNQLLGSDGRFSRASSRGVKNRPGAGLLYVGKAGNLRRRIKNHFQQPSARDNFFIDQVQKIGYAETDSEIEALLMESRLIKERQPKYNVMWRDDKNYFYVAITKPARNVSHSDAGGEEFPRVFLTHQPNSQIRNSNIEIRNKLKTWQIQNSKPLVSNFVLRASDFNYVGPFTEGKPIKLALRSLRGIFPYYISRTHPKTLCQYCHLGLCPGPTPDKKQYRKNIRNLVSVLQGKKTSVLNNLKKGMRLASQQEHYEKAANLRDQIQALEAVFSHSFLFSQAPHKKQERDYASLEPGLRAILGSTKKIVRMEAYDISNIQGKEATGSMVVFAKGKPDKDQYRKSKIHLEGRPNDVAMMKELISRRLSHREWPSPDFMLIDGGKGQLGAALEAFKNNKSALQKISLGALAKRNNELFLPGRRTSVPLNSASPALRNVLMHIRDEAHRFAISYHRKLHRKGLMS